MKVNKKDISLMNFKLFSNNLSIEKSKTNDKNDFKVFI